MDIKELRNKNGLTQVELGRMVGVSSQTIRFWEWGDSKPSEENMKKLEELFNDQAKR